MKQLAYGLLNSNDLTRRLFKQSRNIVFPGSTQYWENRYRKKGNSGRGSYGSNAQYKASVLNQFVAANDVKKVIEFGCGDGNQLKQFHFQEYIGLDVSPTAIKLCTEIFKEDTSKIFFLYDQHMIKLSDFHPDLCLSLDVIYHLVEDTVYEKYMRDLFSLKSQYVIIYAWDVEEGKKYHVRHRNFSKWINDHIADYQLKERITQSPFCDFFIYEKISDA